MKASLGGMVSLVILAVFLIILTSFLLFNVSYAKAFRVKNKIITTYEEYEGNCGKNTVCYKEIEAYEGALGYDVTAELTTEGNKNCTCYRELGYCATEVPITKKIGKKKVKSVKYIIRTEVYIRFPFIQDILGVGVFNVTGETNEIVK